MYIQIYSHFQTAGTYNSLYIHTYILIHIHLQIRLQHNALSTYMHKNHKTFKRKLEPTFLHFKSYRK